MKIQLAQFALFRGIQAQLDGITAEQLVTTTPGEPLKGDEKVIGTLPDHLKALLYLRGQAAQEANKIIDTLPHKMSKQVLEKLEKLKQVHEKAETLFWTAVKAEYPDIAEKAVIGCGSNFEIWYSDRPSQKQSGLADILRGALVVHIG